MKFDSNGWLDAAIEVDYLNKSESREGNVPKFLILHGTAGGTSAQAIANYFATGSEQASAHIIIDQQGVICQGIPLSLAAWANGPIDGTPADNLGFRTESDGVHRDSWWDPNLNPNYITISIEHVKSSTDNSDSLTPAQQAASFAVVNTICDTYGIPKRFADASGGITGHFSMSAINRQHCPGPYPWQDLFNGGNTMDSVLNHSWVDDPTNKILKDPNGTPVTLGFRDFILNPVNNWDPNNIPLEPEKAVNPVEQSNPSLGAGTSQLFRLCRMGYTAKMGVYVTWVGQELQWYQKQYTAQQAQIAVLQKQPSVANLNQINTLASQIEKLSVVQ